MARYVIAAVAVLCLLYGHRRADADLLISQFLANPEGTDSPHEYVELVATRDIDFDATPYTVVFANNGSAAADGWIAGDSKTYGFNLDSGGVGRGDVVYVGGSLAQPVQAGGLTLRTINTGVDAGDAFGSPSRGGVLGNGGGNADAIAVFSMAASSLTRTTVPVDAVFFGDAIGSAFVGPGEGFTLPHNDHYGGGTLSVDSFLYAGGGSQEIGILEGTFDTANEAWTIGRTLSYTTQSPTAGTTAISLTTTSVPEPGTLVLGMLAAVPAAVCLLVKRRRWRRRGTQTQ